LARMGKAPNRAGGETNWPDRGDGDGAKRSVCEGDWSALEAVPAAGSGDCNTYLFAGGENTAWLGGQENDYHFLVIAPQQFKAQVGLGRFLLHLAPGPPARLCVELRGLPPAAAAAAGDGVVRFMGAGPSGGSGGGVVERVDEWPRRCRIGAVAVQLLDEWGNTVPAQAGRSSLQRQRQLPTLEAAGAMLVVGEDIRGKEPTRSWRCAETPSSTAREVMFKTVHFAADEGAIEARLIVRCALGASAGGGGGQSQAPPAAAVEELYAEVLLGLAGTNKVVRVKVTALDCAGGGWRLLAGQIPAGLVVTVETEDSAGFCGPGPTLAESLVAVCSYAPSPLAGPEVATLTGNLAIFSKPMLASSQQLQVEEHNHSAPAESSTGAADGCADMVEGGARAAVVRFEGVKTLWGPGEYTVRVRYTEKREMLLDSLLPGDVEVVSDPLQFQVRMYGEGCRN
jgi:hypothetical protein